MSPDTLPTELDEARDRAYPATIPPDAMYPGQTRAPLGSPLDEIATPSMWSRLASPLERTLRELWQRLGLLERNAPGQWVGLHYGRIAINAHAWERLRARYSGLEPDASLVAPPRSALERIPEQYERLRARLRRRSLQKRVERAGSKREERLTRAKALQLADLDAGELARGLLDEQAWTEILLPWLGRRLDETAGDLPDPSLRAAIALEQRTGAELGRRLEMRGVLESPAQIAYLTVEERIRAVHDESKYWAALADSRAARVEEFKKIDVPVQFWGRPRMGGEDPEPLGY